MKHLLSTLSLCTAALLSACGGGGGADSPGTDTPLTLGAFVGVGESGGNLMLDASASALGLSDSASAGGAQGVLSAGTSRLVFRTVQRIVSDATVSLEQPQAVSSETVMCDYTGSFTVTANDANNNLILDAGDSITYSFTNCAFSSGEPAVGGSLAFTVNSVSGSGASATVRMTVVYGNFGTSSSNLNGSASVTATNTSMSFTYNGVDVMFNTRSAKYYHTVAFNTSGVNPTATLNGNVVFNGAGYSLSTPVTIVFGNIYPTSGTLRVTDKKGGYVNLIAALTTLTIDLYLPGDGVRDAQAIINWTDLAGLDG